MASRTPLDITADPIDLTAALIDIPSPSRAEAHIADEVEAALRAAVRQFPVPHRDSVEIVRTGNCVMARTNRGFSSRVMLAGHLDTVPIADNVPSYRTHGLEGEILHGCGSVDMKSGDAVFLHAFATLAPHPELAHDLTLVMYDCEEIEARFNGLGAVEQTHHDWLEADLAILGEPTGGLIEAGCQGTLRLTITARGVRAHSARSWLGKNAIHRLAPVLAALENYQAREVDIDGCVYREGLQAVRVSAGVAGNVVPDEASIDVNFRFAPDRSPEQAVAHARAALGLDDPAGLNVVVDDLSPGALPGLTSAAAQALIASAGGVVRAKYGWTDVSRFAALGMAAVNFGPGDPGFAHKRDEQCPTSQITAVSKVIRQHLTTPTGLVSS